MVYSIAAGSFNLSDTDLEVSDKSILSNFSQGKFARLTHEGLIGSSFLYVVSLGMNTAKTQSQYDYTGVSTRSKVSGVKSDISMVEGRLGAKYLIKQWLYIGGGALIGDLQLNHDRDSYVSLGGNLENYIESENKNYFGHYYEAGIMITGDNLGFRIGAELNSVKLQKNLETLGDVQPELNSTKVYLELLWKN